MSSPAQLMKVYGCNAVQLQRHLNRENSKFGSEFVEMPTTGHRSENIRTAYRNRDFLVQVFAEGADITRLSINRTSVTPSGTRWLDGITWDELMGIKAAIGYGDCCAVEIYPPDNDVVDVANMRHLWVLPEELEFMWKNDEKGNVPCT